MIRLQNILTITAFIFIQFYCLGQGYENPDKNLIPPSPTAYELGRYGAQPVSFYSGTPSIGIPIYTLDAGGFSLPISLSYNASGIKVEEIASWVGLGWSLNAGGVISVITKGASDFINERVKIRSSQDLLENDMPLVDTLVLIRGKLIDSEPDIYNFNFCGYTGQFVLDNNFRVQFVKNSNGLEIIADKVNRSFIVKDLNGRKFYFDSNHVEMSFQKKLFYGCYYNYNTYAPYGGWTDVSSYSIPTAFYLSKVELENNGGTIIFQYESELVRYMTLLNGSISSIDGIDQWESENLMAFTQYQNFDSTMRLKRIQFYKEAENIEILFHGNTERIDLKGTFRLDKIELKRNSNTTFVWKFAYDYFVSPITKQEEITSNELHKRLKLLSVQRFDNANQAIEPPYLFTYLGDAGSSNQNLTMPYRTSFDGYDHWGFCNKNDVSLLEANMPSNLFPNVNYQNFVEDKFICLFSIPYGGYRINPIREFSGNNPINLFDNFVFERGDREPNAIYMKAYTLEQIKYPTGGYTQFDYEPHQYGYNYITAGGLRLKRQIAFDGIGSVTEKTYSYYSGQLDKTPSYIKAKFTKNENTSDFIQCGADNCPPETLPSGFILNTSTINTENTTNTDYIGYLGVIETIINGEFINGSVIYKYRFPTNNGVANYDYTFAYKHNDSYDTSFRSGMIVGYSQPVYPFTSGLTAPSYKRGLLESIRYINSNNIQVKKEEFFYNLTDENIIYGNEVYCENPSDSELWFVSAYKLYGGKAFQDSIVTTIWDEDGGSPITTTVTKEYNTIYELPKKVTETGTDVSITEYTYPFEFNNLIYPGNVYRQMSENHMINYPIETIRKRNGKVIEASAIDYHRFSVTPLIINQREVLSLENVTGLNDFSPIHWDNNAGAFIKDSRYKTSVVFDAYDNTGRLTQFTPTNNAPQSYIWSPTGSQYPNAKVINSTSDRIAYTSFEEGTTSSDVNLGNWRIVYGPPWSLSNIAKTGKYALQTTSGGSPIETINLIPPGKYKISCWYKDGTIDFPSGTESTLENNGTWYYKEGFLQLNSSQKLTVLVNNGSIDELRLYPVDASIKTYCYDGNRNMLGSFDNNDFGYKYEYDSAGRLRLIRDHNDKILKRYKYNYAP